jgi:hypothetical protein
VGEGGEGDSAEGVADEVEEGGAEGDESAVGSQTVADGCAPRRGSFVSKRVGTRDARGGRGLKYRTCRAP